MRSDQGRRRRNDEIHLTGEQRLNHYSARADGDDFGVQAISFKKTFLVGDPDRRVGRRAARPGDAHEFLSEGGIQQRQKDNRSNRHLQQLHTTLLTLDERMREYSVGAILLSIRFAAGYPWHESAIVTMIVTSCMQEGLRHG